MSNFRTDPCHFINIFDKLIGFMSHIDFKKWPCHPVDFKREEPHYRLWLILLFSFWLLLFLFILFLWVFYFFFSLVYMHLFCFFISIFKKGVTYGNNIKQILVQLQKEISFLYILSRRCMFLLHLMSVIFISTTYAM